MSAAVAGATAASQRNPSRKRVPVHPQTGMPLRPGQRLPTRDDQAAAHASLCAPQLAPFPIGQPWELTPEHCREWLLHNFQGRRGDTNHFRRLADLADDEWALLLWDLDCWFDLRRQADLGRRPLPPPLHEYLRESRADWGLIGVLLREWAAQIEDEDGDGE